MDDQNHARWRSQLRLGFFVDPLDRYLAALGVAQGFGHCRSSRFVLSVLTALLSVTLIKGFSQTNCPWDLQGFGGLAPYVSHWNLWFGDGSGGHCFPAGHASTGFAFMAAYFGLRQNNAPGAMLWLVLAIGVGFILGFSQLMRGAHFMSHTLWTAWLCWTVGWMSHALFHLIGRNRKS